MTDLSVGSVVTLVVYALATVILFVGATVERRRYRRERAKPMTEEEALEGVRNFFSGGFVRWVALAAVALLLPRLWRSSEMPGWETVWTAFLLGLAGKAAQSVVDDWSDSTRYRAWVAAAVVIAGGLTVGLTSQGWSVMIAASAVVIISTIVILVGAVAELRQAIRECGEPLSQQEALEGLRTVFSGAIFGWIALAAIGSLLPRLWRDSNLSGRDALLVLALLAFAGDRAHYLVATWLPTTMSRRARVAGIASLVLAGGLAVGMTS